MSLLSAVAIDALLEARALEPVPGSVLLGYRGAATHVPADGVAQAVDHLNADSKMLEAAKLLARPSTVLELAEVNRERTPFVKRLYLSAERACAAMVTPAGVELEPLMSLRQLIDKLTTRLAGPHLEHGAPPIGLIEAEASLLAHLWGARGKAVTVAQTAEVCIAALVKLGVSRADAEKAIGVLETTKVLKRTPRGLTVAKDEAHALQSLWSGLVLELRAGPVDGSRAVTVVFVGPEGKRYQLERVPAAKSQAGEDSLVFHSFSRVGVKQRLTNLLGAGSHREAGE